MEQDLDCLSSLVASSVGHSVLILTAWTRVVPPRARVEKTIEESQEQEKAWMEPKNFFCVRGKVAWPFRRTKCLDMEEDNNINPQPIK